MYKEYCFIYWKIRFCKIIPGRFYRIIYIIISGVIGGNEGVVLKPIKKVMLNK